MNCPVCREKTSVTDTVRGSKSVHRKRWCKKCGRIFYTEEHVVESPERYCELRHEYDKRRRYQR